MRVAAVALVSLLLLPTCKNQDRKAPSSTPSAAASLAPPALSSAPPVAPPIEPPTEPRVESVDVPGDLPVFVVRAARPTARERIVFLHGLCGHPFAYADSFRHAAARIGTMIALQGNVSCGNGYRDWSMSPAKVDDRVEAAFKAVGDSSDLRDLIVIGYSSGGTFAELLVLLNPARYTRAVLIANPRSPAFYRLKTVRGAVMMAGQRDRHDLMKQGNRDLQSRSIPSTFMVLPGAAHGEMGNDAERVMGQALDWLLAHARRDNDTDQSTEHVESP